MYVESIVMHYEQREILDNDGSYKNYIQVQNQINVVDKDKKKITLVNLQEAMSKPMNSLSFSRKDLRKYLWYTLRS